MSLGWKQFNYYNREEKSDVQIPADLCCACSDEHHLFWGCTDGTVTAFDRALRLVFTFQAYATNLQHIHRVKEHPFLLTVGNDLADESSVSLRTWQIHASDNQGPQSYVRSVKLFGSRMAPSKVWCVAVYDAAWPVVQVAVGGGGVYLLQGDAVRGNMQRTVVLPSDGAQGPLTALHFIAPASSAAPMLFAVSANQTRVVDTISGSVSTLDESGCAAHCSVVSPALQLLEGRARAVFCYDVEGRGPAYAFDGEKELLHWAGRVNSLAVVSRVPNRAPGTLLPAQRILQIYDLQNKIVAANYGIPAEGTTRAASFNGVLVLLVAGGKMLVFREKDLGDKLDMLFSKNLYNIALGVAASHQADAAVVADVHRRYGDHLYIKHDYDAAVQQYLATIGHLEPSFVIRKFLDAQRIHNLTLYLEALHDEGRASADHTTLLLNCYTKLNDVAKLDKFIRAEDHNGQPLLAFDVDTAIKVLRGAGYFHHALFIAKATASHEVVLDILTDETQQYDAAIEYLDALPRKLAAKAMQRHGKVLITERPEPTTALLMQLCTVPYSAAADGADGEAWTAQVSDFSHLYSDRPLALLLLCEFILNSSAAPPNERMLYHTLLELYLQPGLDADDAAAETADKRPEASASARGVRQAADRRRESALELLKRGWQQSGADGPVYDAQHALVLCQLYDFDAGKVFLYTAMRMFREVLHVRMCAHDWPGMMDACLSYGDPAKGGDPHLWTLLLDYLASTDSDCSQQVKEVLKHLEAGNVVPPLMVVETLARNPHLQLGLVKGYLANTLAAETAAIEEDRQQIEKYKTETAAMRQELAALKEGARVFQNSKCALSGSPLELPAVHFMCGHSFNLRALPDPEGRECPLCAPGFRTILDIKKSLAAGASQQDRFFKQLHSSADGFSVVAEFFGRGLMNSHEQPTATGL